MSIPRSKEHNILRALPFVLTFGILLLMSLVGYDGYKQAHPKPKATISKVSDPTRAWYAGKPCDNLPDGTYSCAKQIHDSFTSAEHDPPFMVQCNGGQYVTELRECREYHQKLIYAFQPPRKHKRETTFIYDHRFPPMDLWQFINTVPAIITCSKLSSASAGQCESRPLTPAEIKQYDPTVWPEFKKCESANETGCVADLRDTKPDCLPGGSVKGDIPPCGQAEKAAEYDQLALDHSQDFYDNVFVPGGECTDRERYRELQCVMGGKCILRNLDSKNWCKPLEPISFPELQSAPPPKDPFTCKMPADIDVCPAQQLDPKAVIHIPLCEQPANCPAMYLDPKKSHD